MGRLPRGHGLRGDRGALRDPRRVRARQVPAGVRPARRFVEPRRQRHRRHDLLGAARARGRDVADRERLPAAGHRAGVRGLRALRAVVDDRADARHRRARLHARPRDRRLPAHPPEPHDSRRHAGVRGQHEQPALLGAAGQALRRGVHRRQERGAGQGLQHALDRVAGRRGAPHPDARRAVHVSARHQGSEQAGPPAPTLRGEPDRLAGRAGRRRRVHGPRPHPRSRADRTPPARTGDPRVRGTRWSASRATTPSTTGARTSRSARRSSTRARCTAAPPNVGARHVGTPSHHRDHRLVGRRHDDGDAHLPAHLPPRGHRRGDSSRAIRSTATTASRCAKR